MQKYEKLIMVGNRKNNKMWYIYYIYFVNLQRSFLHFFC